MSSLPSELPRTVSILQHGIDEQLHPGAQLYVSQNGNTIADLAIGDAQLGTPMTRDSITLWLSATKPIAAVAIAQLWERGLLTLDDRVAAHIPEFAQHGKDPITLRHLLTHTGGFRAASGAAANAWAIEPWDAVVAAVCAARLEPRWVPGHKAGYHPSTSWIILGELVRRLDGRPFDRYVREMVFEPLGMTDSWIGMSPEKYREYREHNRLVASYDTSKGASDPDTPLPTEAACALVRPGANGRGPIRELGKFYEALLAAQIGRASLPASRECAVSDGSAGASPSHAILSPQTIEALVARHRTGMFDHTFKHVMDWGLGFVVDSKQYGVDTVPYGYGPHASPRNFGHSGAQSACAFADPENDLVVAWVCNGLPGEDRHQSRQRAINAAIYEDLGLVSPPS
jgi:CubicO group peptidase (beta-lactamase class C family)